MQECQWLLVDSGAAAQWQRRQSSPDGNMLHIPDFVALMPDSLVLKEILWAKVYP